MRCFVSLRGGKKRLGEKGVDDDVDTIVNFEGKGMKRELSGQT